MNELPCRIGDWGRQQQDSVVRQIAASGSPHRAQLLLQLIEGLDPLIIPEAIDEISLGGENTPAEQLMELAYGSGAAITSPYVQLKAVEALGRLRTAGAESQLSELLMHRTLLGWVNPRELRVTAMQALQRVNPEVASSLMQRSGLTDTELKIGPLDGGDTNWVRQRRYARVVPNGPISAATITSKGKCNLALERLSLGGGFASRNGRAQVGTEAMLEMQLGLRSIRSRVLIREAQAGMMFEIADISLDERSKLRKLIAAQMK
jgi:hypothetical protein